MYLMQMMFFGVVFMAAFGAAGVLSAIAATYQGADSDNNPGLFQEDARNYLIGTSVSYHGHNVKSKLYSLLYKSCKCVRIVNTPL